MDSILKSQDLFGSIINRSQINQPIKAKLQPIIEDPFIGLLLKDRFLIRSYFTEGEFGRFYIAHDMHNCEHEVIVKISTNLDMNKQEYLMLGHLNQLSPSGLEFPRLYAGGEFIINKKIDNGPVSNSISFNQETMPDNQ